MPPIESYTIIDGNRIPDPVPGATPPAPSAQESAPEAGQTGVPGATAPPPAGDGQPSDSPSEPTLPGGGEPPGDPDEDEPLRDDSEITAARLERRFARLTRLRRQAERELEEDRQRHNLEMARTRGELEALSRMLAGAAPALPQTPAPPTGPPQAEQFERHEEFIHAAAGYAADQRFQQQRQVEHQAAFQHALMSREAAFKEAHPDFDSVVRGGLAGKVSPVLQQALMLVPDGPAVAYALARQPDLVQRLNQLPPPLVLVELGRLSPTPASTSNGTAGGMPTPAQGAPPLPAPPTPLSGAGAGAPTGTYSDSMDQAAYRAWRKRTSNLPVWKNS